MPMLKKYPSEEHVSRIIENINRTPPLDKCYIKSEIRYRHYKGGVYKYICDATLEWCPDDPNSHVIIYESVTDGKRWVRPRNEFFGYTKSGERRFVKIEE